MRLVLCVMAACALSACNAAAPPPQPENPTVTDAQAKANEQLVRRMYDEYINPGRLDRLGEVVSDDFTSAGPQRGPAAFAVIGELRAAFPDLRYDIKEVVADRDRVAVRWTLRGTHTGKFKTYEPTGKRIANNGFAIFRVENGKLVGGTVETDRLGFLLTIGVIPYDPAFGPPPTSE